MTLKMYEFGGSYDITTWIVAKSKEQAISIFEGDIIGCSLDSEVENVNEYVREAEPGEYMTYRHDENTVEKETMENLIKKYCDSPGVFATSDF